jgi:hypothetical protein
MTTTNLKTAAVNDNNNDYIVHGEAFTMKNGGWHVP